MLQSGDTALEQWQKPDMVQCELILHVFIKPFLILWLSSKHIFTQKTRWNPERAAVIKTTTKKRGLYEAQSKSNA